MGANDDREMLGAAKVECVRLERALAEKERYIERLGHAHKQCHEQRDTLAGQLAEAQATIAAMTDATDVRHGSKSERLLKIAMLGSAPSSTPEHMKCPGCGHDVHLDPMDGWRNDSDGFTCNPPNTTHSQHIIPSAPSSTGGNDHE